MLDILGFELEKTPGTGLCAILEPRPSQGGPGVRKMGDVLWGKMDDRPDLFHEFHGILGGTPGSTTILAAS